PRSPSIHPAGKAKASESPIVTRERIPRARRYRHELPVKSLARPEAMHSAFNMSIELDHVMIPARNQRASAGRLATLLGVPWAESGAGPFSPVFVNAGLTLDFIDDSSNPFPVQHFCFRVDDETFDAILNRLERAGVAYRSSVHGPVDMQVNTQHG